MKQNGNKSETERLLEILDPLRHEDVALRFCRLDGEGGCELIPVSDRFILSLNCLRDDFLEELRTEIDKEKKG